MMSKYGNFTTPVPDFKQEIFVIEDQFEKELITEAEKNKKLKKINKAKLLYIVYSNGGYTPKRMKRNKISLTDQKEMHAAKQARDFLKTLNDGATDEAPTDTSEAVTPPTVSTD